MTPEEKLRNKFIERVDAELLLQRQAESRAAARREARRAKTRWNREEKSRIEAEQIRQQEELQAARPTRPLTKTDVASRLEKPEEPLAPERPPRPGAPREGLSSEPAVRPSARRATRRANTRAEREERREEIGRGQGRTEPRQALQATREAPAPDPPEDFSQALEEAAQSERRAIALREIRQERTRRRREEKRGIEELPVAREEEPRAPRKAPAPLVEEGREDMRARAIPEEPQAEPTEFALAERQAVAQAMAQAVTRAAIKRDRRLQRRQRILAESAAHEALAEARVIDSQEAVVRAVPDHPEEAPPAAEPEDSDFESEVAPPEPVPGLLRLNTRGSFVVNENCQSVALRGVTVAGLDALALDPANLALMTGPWGINIIRLPLDAGTVLSGDGSSSAAQTLTALDGIVSAVTLAGAYVLLSPGAASESIAAQVCQTLAARYQSEPGVLYELLSPPAPIGDNWLQQAALLVGAIRMQNPAALIFLGNGTGGADCTGLPLRFSTGAPVFNIVYTIGVSAASPPDPDSGGLRELCDAYPVFASGWSDGGGSDLGRLAGFVADIFSRFGIGFAANTWNADPRLVADAANHDFTPTGWGLVVRRAAALPVRPLFIPFEPNPM